MIANYENQQSSEKRLMKHGKKSVNNSPGRQRPTFKEKKCQTNHCCYREKMPTTGARVPVVTNTYTVQARKSATRAPVNRREQRAGNESYSSLGRQNHMTFQCADFAELWVLHARV